MEYAIITVLNGVSYGLLLFLLSSGAGLQHAGRAELRARELLHAGGVFRVPDKAARLSCR
jgi:hypothetical protein